MMEEEHTMDRKVGTNEDVEVRKGPWTMEEDLVLINYIANHGDGVWNTLARSAGLKRTGKSCRLRWLNYLRPDVRRGNITPEEQLLIMELHDRWGNRWSKIAKELPGRTDNEIKNFWRTRVQKKSKNGESSEGQISMLSDETSAMQMDEVDVGVSRTSYDQGQTSNNLGAFEIPFEPGDNLLSVEELWAMQY